MTVAILGLAFTLLHMIAHPGPGLPPGNGNGDDFDPGPLTACVMPDGSCLPGVDHNICRAAGGTPVSKCPTVKPGNGDPTDPTNGDRNGNGKPPNGGLNGGLNGFDMLNGDRVLNGGLVNGGFPRRDRRQRRPTDRRGMRAAFEARREAARQQAFAQGFTGLPRARMVTLGERLFPGQPERLAEFRRLRTTGFPQVPFQT